MKRYLLNITLLLVCFSASSQETEMPKADWNGYTQLRFTSNFNEVNSFSMRRLKLWVNSTPSFNNRWGWKVQTTLTSNQNEKFFLQDVLVYYKEGQFQFNMGQFVPHFSLQRFQPDFQIPLTERSTVIDALIPNGTLGVRDIGIETQYTSKSKQLKAWLGVFNGYGIKEYRFDNTGILLTQKTALNINNGHFHLGYSFMYRKANNLKVQKILPDSITYSGGDIRLNAFAQYRTKHFSVQAEYLQANFEGYKSDGWYLLANLLIGKNIVAASWNMYNDAIESNPNFTNVHLAYSYIADGDKLKVMIDNGINIQQNAIQNYVITLQLQIFLNDNL
ncbi:porin [Tenuifilum thalassicum]|uniref:Porin n=1 Tax=Tenuifilum thalassicum TaxID=2590900 RepID=A0A7D3XTU4_9BACT|nr:porin [Tenuifilum thalassicum]QKG79151.1 hypothetical protein FHG85_02355 [Tenuifilum thalassicum]